MWTLWTINTHFQFAYLYLSPHRPPANPSHNNGPPSRCTCISFNFFANYPQLLLNELIMMHFFLVFLLFLLGSQQGYAADLETYLEIGVHSENFKVKLEDQNGNIENSFVKIEWNNWIAPEIRAGGIYRFYSCFTLEAEGGVLLKTDSGRLSSSYRLDASSRSSKFEKCNKNISGNQFSIALGWIDKITQNVSLTTLVGYSEQRDSLHGNSDNFLLKIDLENEMNKIDLSNMSCRNSWKGPWIGCRVNYFPCSDLSLFLEGEYHYVCLQSHSHWHAKECLSDHFQFDTKGSILHKGNAQGLKLNGVIVKDLAANWKVRLHGYYEQIFKHKRKASLKLQELAYMPNEHLFSQGISRMKTKSAVQLSAWAILGGIDYVF